MGQEFYCDLCHKSLPAADSLIPLIYGDQQIAGLCITCSSALKTAMQRKLAEARAAFDAARQEPLQPAPAAPPAEAPPQAPPEVPPQAAVDQPE